MTIYFASTQHQNNYEKLKLKFAEGWSTNYAISAYVSALPGVYDQINWEEMSWPLEWAYGQWKATRQRELNIEEGYMEESERVGRLSSSYRELVRAALNLLGDETEHQADVMILATQSDASLYKVFLQLLELKRESKLLQLAPPPTRVHELQDPAKRQSYIDDIMLKIISIYDTTGLIEERVKRLRENQRTENVYNILNDIAAIQAPTEHLRSALAEIKLALESDPVAFHANINDSLDEVTKRSPALNRTEKM